MAERTCNVWIEVEQAEVIDDCDTLDEAVTFANRLAQVEAV